jgi:hypothetical protein
MVVLAEPIDQRKLPTQVNLPGILQGNDPIPAIQVETTFSITAVLHGDAAEQKTFVLLHYREANPTPPKGPVLMSGPALVDFKAKSGKQYLMFLHRDDDGRYSAYVGQTDPAISIREVVPPTP